MHFLEWIASASRIRSNFFRSFPERNFQPLQFAAACAPPLLLQALSVFAPVVIMNLQSLRIFTHLFSNQNSLVTHICRWGVHEVWSERCRGKWRRSDDTYGWDANKGGASGWGKREKAWSTLTVPSTALDRQHSHNVRTQWTDEVIFSQSPRRLSTFLPGTNWQTSVILPCKFHLSSEFPCLFFFLPLLQLFFSSLRIRIVQGVWGLRRNTALLYCQWTQPQIAHIISNLISHPRWHQTLLLHLACPLRKFCLPQEQECKNANDAAPETSDNLKITNWYRPSKHIYKAHEQRGHLSQVSQHKRILKSWILLVSSSEISSNGASDTCNTMRNKWFWCKTSPKLEDRKVGKVKETCHI